MFKHQHLQMFGIILKKNMWVIFTHFKLCVATALKTWSSWKFEQNNVAKKKSQGDNLLFVIELLITV